MSTPYYIGLTEARRVLAGIGIEMNERQIKRAASVGKEGKRKLPFFVDPVDNKLKVDKQDLLAVYTNLGVQASRNAQLKPSGPTNYLERGP